MTTSIARRALARAVQATAAAAAAVRRVAASALPIESSAELYRCTACGCTYGTWRPSCAECWNARVTRVR